jgi:hypothetical protein
MDAFVERLPRLRDNSIARVTDFEIRGTPARKRRPATPIPRSSANSLQRLWLFLRRIRWRRTVASARP